MMIGGGGMAGKKAGILLDEHEVLYKSVPQDILTLITRLGECYV